MPEDTKKLVEKTERDYGRRGIRNLHQASTYLGKVKEHLAEVQDHRTPHRSLCMKHLSTGIQMWEKQLEEYRGHQAYLAEQAEITATSRIIQQFSHTAGGVAAAPPPTIPAPPPPTIPAAETEDTAEETVDKEEDSMPQQLQSVISSCAGSLGMDIEAPKMVEVEDDGEESRQEADNASNKRPRSLEAFGGKPPSS